MLNQVLNLIGLGNRNTTIEGYSEHGAADAKNEALAVIEVTKLFFSFNENSSRTQKSDKLFTEDEIISTLTEGGFSEDAAKRAFKNKFIAFSSANKSIAGVRMVPYKKGTDTKYCMQAERYPDDM